MLCVHAGAPGGHRCSERDEGKCEHATHATKIGFSPFRSDPAKG